jgi:hypothetical protein
MLRHRHSLRWPSGLMVLLLVFMQLATSAYACRGAVQAVQAVQPVAMADMPGCEGHMSGVIDLEQPQLCKAHCEQGNQAVGTAATADLTYWPVLFAVLDWRHAALVPEQPARLSSDSLPLGAPPGSPPIYLSLLVLRN